jgi:hypothetical protein
MFRKNKKRLSDLDSLGTEIIRAAAVSDQETESSASSPYLFARVRAEIETRKKLDAGLTEPMPMLAPGAVIFAMFKPGKLKLGLAAFLVVAATGFWTVWARSMSQPTSQVSSPQEVGLTACSLSNADKCVISTNDVVQLVVNGNSREPGK